MSSESYKVYPVPLKSPLVSPAEYGTKDFTKGLPLSDFTDTSRAKVESPVPETLAKLRAVIMCAAVRL